MKMAKLWVTAAYAVLLLAIVETIAVGFQGLHRYWNVLIGNWFLNGYCCLLLLAPLVNIALGKLLVETNEEERSAAVFSIKCLLVLTLGWGFLTTIPHVSKFIPRTPGVWSYTGLALVGIYTVARLCRQFDFWKYLDTKKTIAILVVCIMAIGFHCGAYSSPFAVGLVAVVFSFMLRLPAPDWICDFSPSMFTIFLLHANDIGFKYMGMMEDCLVGRGLHIDIAMFVTAVVTFGIGLLLDLPRRSLVGLCSKLHEKVKCKRQVAG